MCHCLVLSVLLMVVVHAVYDPDMADHAWCDVCLPIDCFLRLSAAQLFYCYHVVIIGGAGANKIIVEAARTIKVIEILSVWFFG